MPKRPSREKPNERKGSADLSDPPPKNKKKRKQEIFIIIDAPPTDPPVEELFQELLIGETPKEVPELPKKIQPAIALTKKELNYFKKLPQEQQEVLNSYMESLNSFTDTSDIPLKFRILSLPVSDYIKSSVLKKVQMLEDDSGEHHKVKNWVSIAVLISSSIISSTSTCFFSNQ